MSYEETFGYLVVHVCDTGVGIESMDMSKLFTRFGKLHRTAYMNSTGIGLGLTIVKQIVEQSNGKIEVRSEGRDQGASFIFSMKLEKGEMPAVEEEVKEVDISSISISLSSQVASFSHFHSIRPQIPKQSQTAKNPPKNRIIRVKSNYSLDNDS